MTLGLFESGVPYQRMLHATGGMQRYRMMRYIMVLGIILVTIFLYVSYYTTPMTVDNRYTAYVPQDQRQISPSSDSDADQNFFVIAADSERMVDTQLGVNTSGVFLKPVDEVSTADERASSIGSNTGGSEAPSSSNINTNNSKTQSGNATVSKPEPPKEEQRPVDGVGEVKKVERQDVEIKNMKPDRATGKNNGD